MGDQRRNNFRVEYPTHERPGLRLAAGQDYKVIDLSESGIRFDPGLRGVFNSGDPIRGAVSFSDGVSFLVTGKVIRASEHQVIVQLTQGIPFSRMLSEERNILQKYGRKTG